MVYLHLNAWLLHKSQSPLMTARLLTVTPGAALLWSIGANNRQHLTASSCHALPHNSTVRIHLAVSYPFTVLTTHPCSCAVPLWHVNGNAVHMMTKWRLSAETVSTKSCFEHIDAETGRRAAPLPANVDDRPQVHLDPAGARDGRFAECAMGITSRALALLRPEQASILGEARPRPVRPGRTRHPPRWPPSDPAFVPERVARFACCCK
jgi:hypothetical protein